MHELTPAGALPLSVARGRSTAGVLAAGTAARREYRTRGGDVEVNGGAGSRSGVRVPPLCHSPISAHLPDTLDRRIFPQPTDVKRAA